MNEPIRGGYYLKARCIEQSDIAHAPPHVREVFDYFQRNAFWQDGKHLKRGELSTSYKEIQEALHWKIGWRKESFTKSQCENAMKYLKKAGMIATRRTTHGFIVSVCNYCRFQDPDNYESHSERYTNATGEPQTPDTTDEEGIRREERKDSTPAAAGFPHDLFERFRATHTECQRVRDFEFQRALASYPGADVAEAVAAFERQLAGAGRLNNPPLREFEKYLKKSAEKKDGSSDFGKKRGGGFDPSRMSDKDLL